MNVQLMTIPDAKQVTTWKYPQEYSFYDFDHSPETLQELLDGTYYAVRDNHGQLTGFFCFGLNAQGPRRSQAKSLQGRDRDDDGNGESWIGRVHGCTKNAPSKGHKRL